MGGQGSTPPGWYPDQNGVTRWFDGNQWTEHTQPGAADAGTGATFGAQEDPPTTPLTQQVGGTTGDPYAQQAADPYAQQQPADPYAQAQGGYGPPGQGTAQYGAGGFTPPPKKKKTGLIVGIIVLVLLLIAAAVLVFFLFIKGDSSDDSGGGGGGGTTSGLPDTPPDEVVQSYIDALKDGDCDTAEGYVTDDFLNSADGECDPSTVGAISLVDFEVGDPDIDESAETATVPVDVTFLGESDTSDFMLVVQDDEWKIDEIPDSTDGEPMPSDLGTDFPTDFGTDFPTDFGTDFPTDFGSDFSDYFSSLLSDFPTS